ncbi:MAG: ACT domain-containing protein, partial [Bryobacteraceae bacterium]
MNARDLSDPATARMLAGRCGTIERLKMLTLIAYADVSAVNPGAMTPWRLEQLWRAYDVTRHQLVRELETGRIQQPPEGLPQAAEFIKGFPFRYLRTHAPAEIEAHLRLREQSRPAGVAVCLERLSGFYRLTVVARDRPFLFASLAGVLSVFGLNIVKVEAFANDKGLILDTFVFADPQRTLDLNPSEVERLQEMAQKAALGKLDVPRLLSDRRSAVKSRRHAIEPSVQFDSEACETATLVEIVAEDRPGLLYDFATVFSSAACNIDVVLIDTEGRKALDVFYVAYGGAKVPSELQEKLRHKLLEVC